MRELRSGSLISFLLAFGAFHMQSYKATTVMTKVCRMVHDLLKTLNITWELKVKTILMFCAD